MEEWRKIPGLPPEFEASNYGRIRRLAGTYKTTFFGQLITRAKPAKIFALKKLSPKGYQRINLCGRVYAVHRLIGKAFILNPLNLPQINHKDGIKVHNWTDNLEWNTNQENRDHAVAMGLVDRGPHPERRKYGPNEIETMAMLRENGWSIRRIARGIGTQHSTITKIFEREGIRY